MWSLGGVVSVITESSLYQGAKGRELALTLTRASEEEQWIITCRERVGDLAQLAASSSRRWQWGARTAYSPGGSGLVALDLIGAQTEEERRVGGWFCTSPAQTRRKESRAAGGGGGQMEMATRSYFRLE